MDNRFHNSHQDWYDNAKDIAIEFFDLTSPVLKIFFKYFWELLTFGKKMLNTFLSNIPEENWKKIYSVFVKIFSRILQSRVFKMMF